MLRRFDIRVNCNEEEPLLGLADCLGVSAFSNPQIEDVAGGGETDFHYTGEVVVSFVASTVEQDITNIESRINNWLYDFGYTSDSLSVEEYADNQDWMLGFREHFRPICISDSIVIRPPWADPLEQEKSGITLLIDPGMAFGTGTHETTRLCLQLLGEIDVKGDFFLDLGAGSGILAFYLMKCGAEGGVAIELEGAAVENMRKNAALNGISDRLQMICADLGNYKPAAAADGLVANITSPVILEYLPLFSRWIKSGGWGIFSGVNSANADRVKDAFKVNGWRTVSERIDGDWHGFYMSMS